MSTILDELQEKSIKELYNISENKKKLIQLLSDKYGRAARSISNNWFSGFFSVPKRLEEKVKEDMICFINTGGLSETTND